jgi:ubiquinone/menaquinone biosynthesis C-methylase UbiE
VLHRALFGAMSLMPLRVRDKARRRAFNAMFSLSDDPWGYQRLGYERRKQEFLLAEVGSTARVIVEVGCADGHNLVALARQLPASTVIGSDVSSVAVRIAAQRTRDFSNVRVIGPDAYDELPESLHDRVDCIVLAEVLYYLVGERAIHDALAPLLRIASADCRVIMLHGSADADRLHDRAARALGLRIANARRIDDAERPFTLAVAQPSVRSPSPCP